MTDQPKYTIEWMVATRDPSSGVRVDLPPDMHEYRIYENHTLAFVINCKEDAFARKIVDTLHSHADLLEACNTLLQAVEQLVPDDMVSGVVDVVLFQARAAIALATPNQEKDTV